VRAPFACHVQSRGALLFLRAFTWPIPLLAPVITTTLPLIPGIEVLPSSFYFPLSHFFSGFSLMSRAIDFNFSCDDNKL